MNAGPGPQDPPRLGRQMLKRFALAALIIVTLSAGATATAGLLEVKDVASALGTRSRLNLGNEITKAEAGAPQTLLLMGSDMRKNDERGHGLSDTMILVRLDPDKKATALLSIPRDLRVRIPLANGRFQTDKINAAFGIGGERLTLKTIKARMGIDVNHVINVRFRGFREAVNFIGCVYTDVDRRYFNDDNSGGGNYDDIDIKPGYQKLCGQDALDYVRFRHEDNDIVRAARQQDFLSQTKEQVGVRRLFGDRRALTKILGRYAQTDLRSTSEVLRLLKLAIFSADNPVREVRFRSSLGRAYVYATREQVRESVNEFLRAEDTEGPRGSLASTRAEREAAGRRKRFRSSKVPGLEEAERAGEDQAVPIASKTTFPVYFPRLRAKLSVYLDLPRVYVIDDDQGRPHKAYRMVLKKGLVGEYYGVQGTTWLDPPILTRPTEKRKVGGREFELFYDGDRLRLVAWRTRRAVYWVSNTLLRTLSNRQMLAIAGSMQRVGS